MYLRIDKLQLELPMAENPDIEAAKAVQELLGGQFGEMSTLMNYTYQSFNMRGKDKLKPYYDLVANIAAEELGHIEAVAATVNGLLTGAAPRQEGAAADSPLEAVLGKGLSHHFLFGGQGALPVDSRGIAWTGENVFNSGDLVLDMLHNFFLECGARMGKLRVYQSTSNPIARELCGYLLTRGGVHQVAYAKALETLTGVEVGKMLNIPNISNNEIPEAKKYHDQGIHTLMYRFSPDDYKDIDKIWKGPHPEDGKPLTVTDELPKGGPINPGTPEPQVYAPGYHPGELAEIAARLMKNA
ncbi:MAG: manganese catalase family protein [Chloroflexota bacterium]|nr:manganese catalase family protein [Chloroflexota bacterium]MDQ3514866.1 manganese catalase family protein [Chloroflexota bacterium]